MVRLYINTYKNIVRKAISKLGRHQWPVFESYLLILAYHRVLPETDKRFSRVQPGMRVSPETFENNLRWAGEHFQFIGLREWLEMCKLGRAPKGKFCAITFDDGWLDNYENALPILSRHMVPATVFCVANMIDGQADYWPGRLTTLVEALSALERSGNASQTQYTSWLFDACKSKTVNWSQPSQVDFDTIIEAVKIYTDNEINEFIDNTRSALVLKYSEQRQVMNSIELGEMLKSGLVEIGSHTCNHIRLSDTTSYEVLNREIVASREKIVSKLNCNVELFCYPNGYHPSSAQTLVASHYLGGCTLSRGWNKGSDDFSLLKRVNLHEDVASDRDVFKSMLSGFSRL